MLADGPIDCGEFVGELCCGFLLVSVRLIQRFTNIFTDIFSQSQASSKASFLRDMHPFSETGILSQRQASFLRDRHPGTCRAGPKPSKSNSLSRAKDEAVPKGAQRASQLRLWPSAGPKPCERLAHRIDRHTLS